MLPMVQPSPALARTANATVKLITANSNTHPRSDMIATNMERTAMISNLSNLSHLHADARRLDFLAEAAAERLVNEALDNRLVRSHSVIAELRHRFGTVLVAFGHRLQHQPAPADHASAFGALRTAR